MRLLLSLCAWWERFCFCQDSQFWCCSAIPVAGFIRWEYGGGGHEWREVSQSGEGREWEWEQGWIKGLDEVGEVSSQDDFEGLIGWSRWFHKADYCCASQKMQLQRLDNLLLSPLSLISPLSFSFASSFLFFYEFGFMFLSFNLFFLRFTRPAYENSLASFMVNITVCIFFFCKFYCLFFLLHYVSFCSILYSVWLACSMVFCKINMWVGLFCFFLCLGSVFRGWDREFDLL